MVHEQAFTSLTLPGHRTIVTGAGSGIGRATGLLLARRGARVLIADIDAESAENTAAWIRQDGGVALSHRVDVRDEDQVVAMVDACRRAWGGVDGAVNNAGIGQFGEPIDTADLRRVRRRIEVNLIGLLACLKHELSILETGGAVVNVASTTGLVGMPGLAAYSASKAGVLGATRAVASEAAARGIRVNAVAPGMTGTDEFLRQIGGRLPEVSAQQPLGRLGRPEEIAEAIAWLLSPAAGYTTGATIVCDGGYTAV